ncbi:TPA: hypothetical protein ACX6Q4_003830 [Photobacterium damselae]
MNQHKLLQLIDQAKPNLQPLNTHFMAQFSVAERQDYATMLAAVITGTGTVTEAQSRLFGMLLTSMELDNDVASYYKSAQELNSVFVEKYVLGNKKTHKANALLFDSSILCYLSSQSDNQSTLLNSINSLFGVDDYVLMFFNALIHNDLSYVNEYVFLTLDKDELYDEYFDVKNEDYKKHCNSNGENYNFPSKEQFFNNYNIDVKSEDCYLTEKLNQSLNVDNLIFVGNYNESDYCLMAKEKNHPSVWFIVLALYNNVLTSKYKSNVTPKIYIDLKNELSVWSDFFKDLEVKK